MERILQHYLVKTVPPDEYITFTSDLKQVTVGRHTIEISRKYRDAFKRLS